MKLTDGTCRELMSTRLFKWGQLIEMTSSSSWSQLLVRSELDWRIVIIMRWCGIFDSWRGVDGEGTSTKSWIW